MEVKKEEEKEGDHVEEAVKAESEKEQSRLKKVNINYMHFQ